MRGFLPRRQVSGTKTTMLRLFEGFGIELEYMIARRSDWSVAPVADRIMIAQCGEPLNDVVIGRCEASNELAAHVFELKTPAPVTDLMQLERDLAEAVRLTNAILTPCDCSLLPGAMHPTMDPAKESATWPHGSKEIYDAYDRIFNCRGHGWFNLQSCHINLPFCGDHEFALLHSAIIILLPMMPALAASSPFCEGRRTGFLDTRLNAYRVNQARCPAITGQIIPEAVFSEEEYRDKILKPMYDQIRPFDPENILQEEWLNSRAAIARFQRNAIEIRLLDMQECPAADLGLAAFFIATIRHLVEAKGDDLRRLAMVSSTASRKEQLFAVIRDGMDAPLLLPEIAEAFALPDGARTIGGFWVSIFKAAPGRELADAHQRIIELILREGNLATRMIRFQREHGGDFRPMLARLAGCLAENQPLHGHPPASHLKPDIPNN